jgi:hypothetical protein
MPREGMLVGPNVLILMQQTLERLKIEGRDELDSGALAVELRDKLTHIHPRARMSQAFHIVNRFAHRASEEWSWIVNSKHMRVLKRRK